MSVKIDPILNDDLNTQFFIKFEFPIPELKVPKYEWDINEPILPQGTSGTNSLIVTYPDFPGFEIRTSTSGTNGTNINYVSEIIRLESQTFETNDGFKDLTEILRYEDTIVGDTDVLYASKEFRFSKDNFVWSEWMVMTDSNLNSVLNGFQNLSYYQFKYDALDIEDRDYDTSIIINKPDNVGWFKVYASTSFFIFDKDYPTQGTLDYSVGYGSDGDYYIKKDTNQIYGPKNNGFWTSPYNLNVTSTTSGNTYQPSFVTDDIYNNALKGTFEPLERDYSLTKFDILFGNDDLYSSEFVAPQKDDFVFFNPLFQGINLTGNETIRIDHTPRYIDPTYVPRIYLQDLTIYANQHIFDVEPLTCLENPGDQVILRPEMTLKAFSFDGFCVEATGITEDRCLEIEFRWSNNGKQWSDWYPMTDANITCLKPDPLSFFYIEVVFTRCGTDETGKICICDFILEGNYQNISKDYEKINRFGMRSDCNYGDTTTTTNGGELDTIPKEWEVTDGSGCATNLGTFNPYDTNRSLNLYEKLANDVSNLFGWEIDFYKTTPDNGGRDLFMHEYQLYNVVAKETVKVLVPDNQFPDNTIMFNQFDLSLFDTFEIHITRAEFHRKFGVGRRPEKRDFLWFCATNRMYQIEHAQTYKEFMNASIYYKVVLKKYQDRKNIDNTNFTDPLNDLLADNSLDNLFQQVVEEETKKVANKEILENLTERGQELIEPHIDSDIEILPGEEPKPFKSVQPIHSDIFAPIVDYQLLNGPNLIAKNYYDLESRTNQIAINYISMNNAVEECDSYTYSVWVNIKSYKVGETYSIIDMYNTVLANGMKIEFVDGLISIFWYGQVFDIDVSLGVNCWYNIICVFDQNKAKLNFGIQKIMANPFATSGKLDLIEDHTFDLEPKSFEGNLDFRLKGSPMLLTNLRWFKTAIKRENWEVLANQYIIKDTSKLIIADSANRIVISPSHKQ